MKTDIVARKAPQEEPAFDEDGPAVRPWAEEWPASTADDIGAGPHMRGWWDAMARLARTPERIDRDALCNVVLPRGSIRPSLRRGFLEAFAEMCPYAQMRGRDVLLPGIERCRDDLLRAAAGLIAGRAGTEDSPLKRRRAEVGARIAAHFSPLNDWMREPEPESALDALAAATAGPAPAPRLTTAEAALRLGTTEQVLKNQRHLKTGLPYEKGPGERGRVTYSEADVGQRLLAPPAKPC